MKDRNGNHLSWALMDDQGREEEEHPRQEEQYEERFQGMAVHMEQREGG